MYYFFGNSHAEIVSSIILGPRNLGSGDHWDVHQWWLDKNDNCTALQEVMTVVC